LDRIVLEMNRLAILALVVGFLGAGTRPARGGATRPKPILAAASAVTVDVRRTVLLEGDFEFPNAVQIGYPLDIVVFQGMHFVRYRVAATPVAGTSTLLADGSLSASELPAFLGVGTPAPANVRIVTLTNSEIRVVLPADFTAGTATALLFTVLTSDTSLSNPISLVLP
jgi:hypothetical protein